MGFVYVFIVLSFLLYLFLDKVQISRDWSDLVNLLACSFFIYLYGFILHREEFEQRFMGEPIIIVLGLGFVITFIARILFFVFKAL